MMNNNTGGQDQQERAAESNWGICSVLGDFPSTLDFLLPSFLPLLFVLLRGW